MSTKWLAKPQSLRAIFEGIIDPTATTYRGVLFRSRLEADFARYLDDSSLDWRYESRLFGPSGSGYLPDFEIVRPDGPDWIEVKPTLAEVPRAQERMEVIWDAYPDAGLVVVCAEESRFFSATAGSDWTSWVQRWHHS